MSKVKKLLAMLMAVVMTLGMSVTAFAAETTNVIITVSNTEKADLYYDQIVVPDTSSTDGWSYVTEYADNFSKITISELVEIAKGSSNGSAANGTLTTSSELAAALESLRSEVQIPANKLENTSQFTAQSGGLYVVIPVKEGYTYSPTLVYVPVNSRDSITVQTKGAPDQILKDVDEDGQSVSAGDEIQYTVNVEYPYISANYTDATFKITDTLTNAKFLIDTTHPVEVSNLTADTDYKVSEANGTTTLEINFNYDSTKAGTSIEIKYWVKVDDNVDSANHPLQNKVDSELKLTPEGTPIKTEYIVISTPVKAVINKVNATGEKLTGAVFAIYEGLANDANPELISIVADVNTTDTVTLPDEYEKNVDLLVKDGNPDGAITFDGLDAQKDYFVVEIIAPNGYQIDGLKHQLIKGEMQSGYPVIDDTDTADDDGIKTITKTYKYKDFKVNEDNNNIVNTALSSLPETGGIGTTIFTIGGCLIMIVAAGLFFATRRKVEK